jgi:hypothetical protein
MRRRTMNGWTIGKLAGAAMVVAALGVAPVARAQSNNKVAAEALFREARKLLDAGKYREACEKLDASEQLDPAVGTLLNLAHCYEKVGRTASAWATYHEAVTAAKLAGQADREKSARRSADTLEPTLPHLTVTVSADAKAAGVQVTRDGVAVVPEIWGTSVPVDPGDHVIAASAPRRKAWSTTITVASSGASSVEVPNLERTEDEGPPESAAPGGQAPSSQSATPRPTSTMQAEPSPEGQPFWNANRTFAVASWGIGVAGGIFAAVEFMRFSDKKNQAETVCPTSCDPAPHALAESYKNDAVDARTLGIVGAAVGGAGLIAGTILWLTAPSASREPATVGLGTAPLPGGLMVSVHGAL